MAHGDVIGRMPTAALCIDDARISEAHALVSLRGGALHLLALRGRFRVAGRVRAEVQLSAGGRIELADGLVLDVEEVRLPRSLLGVEGDGLPRQLLPGTVAIDVRPVVRVRPRWHPDAAAVLWQLDEVWRVLPRGGTATVLRAGDAVDLDGWVLRAVAIPLGDAGRVRTRADFAAPLTLHACVDTVRITVGESAPAVVGGLPGRLLAELAALGGPATWLAVARELWREDDEHVLRRRWDVTVARLRAQLRDLGVRDDLVHADGTGQFELLLHTGDRVHVVDG